MLKIINILLLIFISSSIAYSQQPTTSTLEATQPLAMQISIIAKNVQSAGYPLITNIELQDGMYKVKALDIQGTPIEVVVDPQKGTIIKPKEANQVHVTLLDAISLVQNKGYHGIYKVEANEGTYTVYALDNQGNKVTLKVDASTGSISKSWF
jgi:uncharacterized membrane protein YkoI